MKTPKNYQHYLPALWYKVANCNISHHRGSMNNRVVSNRHNHFQILRNKTDCNLHSLHLRIVHLVQHHSVYCHKFDYFYMDMSCLFARCNYNQDIVVAYSDAVVMTSQLVMVPMDQDSASRRNSLRLQREY